MKTAFATAALLLGTATAIAPAQAQSGSDAVDLASWDRGALQQGWSAEELLDEDVYGATGDEIGEVEDILVGSDGKIAGVIVETDAFLDIGDTHALVDWAKVSAGPEQGSIRIPSTKEELEQFSRDFDDVESIPGAYRLRDLLDKEVGLNDAAAYGEIEDVIFSSSGRLEAVLVDVDERDGWTAGRYAYPYAGWGRGADGYRMPYTRNQVAAYDPIDLDWDWDGPFD